MNDLTDFVSIAKLSTIPYFNTIINSVNDHIVRLAVMSGPYIWHFHPNSDETFIGVEGTVIIETPNATFELSPGTSKVQPSNSLIASNFQKRFEDIPYGPHRGKYLDSFSPLLLAITAYPPRT